MSLWTPFVFTPVLFINIVCSALDGKHSLTLEKMIERTNADWSVYVDEYGNLTLWHRKCLAIYIWITQHFHILLEINQHYPMGNNKISVINQKQYHTVDNQF